MAQAVRAHARQTDQQSNTTTTFTTELSISASALTTAGFAANDDVIVMYLVSMGVDDNQNHLELQLTYDGTALGESVANYDFNAVVTTTNFVHRWWTKVNLGGTVGDIDIDVRSVDDPGTAYLNKIELVVIRLSDFGVENTDWFFAKDTIEEVMTDAWADTIGASITFTPSGVEDWVVLGAVQLIGNGGSVSAQARINREGTVLAGGWNEEWESPTEEKRWIMWDIDTSLAASEHTVTIEAQDDSTAGTRSDHKSSELLIFRRDIWADIYLDDVGTIAMVNNTNTQIATITDTLSTAQDVLMLVDGDQVVTIQAITYMWVEDSDTAIDPLITPTAVLRAAKTFDGTDIKQSTWLGFKNLSGTLNLDVNARQNTGSTQDLLRIQFLAWGMELADVPADPYPPFPRRPNRRVRM